MIPHARCLVPACVFAAGLCLDCGDTPDRALDRGSTVVIACRGYDGQGFNPALVGNEKDLLFLPLMRINASGELEGALAERWETFPETGDVIYHLRDGVCWHDGIPVTAHDVKFSMELMTHPNVLHEGPGLFEEIEIIDDLTLRVRDHSGGTDEVSWPKHLLEDLEPAEFYNWDFWRRPVGNGAYRFVRYQPNTFLELEANPDYVGGKPRIERLILKFVGAAGVRELVAGEVDAVLNVRSPDALSLEDDPRFETYHQYYGWWIQQVIYWRHDNPLFQDANVRRALTLAIDRRELQRLLRYPRDTPIVDAPYSLRQLARNALPDPLPHDPAQAEMLLERAGWIDSDGDGVRERQGRRFNFTTLVYNGDSNDSVIAVFVQDQLRKVGVEMDILPAEMATIMARGANGNLEAAISWFTFNLNRTRRITGYEDAELNRLQKETYGWLHQDPEKKAKGYRRAHEIFIRDSPVTFLGPGIKTNIVHKRIRGLSSPWRANPIQHLESLWIGEGPGP